MPLNLFKVLLILLVFICTSTKSSKENEITTSIFDELSEEMEAYFEDYDANDTDAYVEKYFPILCYARNGYISRKHNCTRQSNFNFTSGDLIRVDNKTYPGFASCARRKGYDLNTLACKKEPYYLYCGEGWVNIWIMYNYYDIYFRTTICIVGCLTNIINFTVLTRRNVINPLNTILAALAINDFLFVFTGLGRIGFSIYTKNFEYVLTCNQSKTKGYIYRICYLTFHIMSTYLTVLVAGWRFFGISFPLKSKAILTKTNAKWAIFILIVGDALYQLLFFLTFHIYELQGVYGQSENGEKTNSTSERETCSVLNFVIGTDVSRHYEKLMLSFFSLVQKWIPFVLLTIFTIGLVWSLIKTNRHWRRVTTSRAKICSGNSAKASDKTNKMLLYILIIFLVTELPSGRNILWWFEDFNRECLRPLVYFFATFEYFSCSASFFVYVTMSDMYRTTMLDIFKTVLQKIRFKGNDSKTSTVSLEIKSDTAISSITS